MVISKKDFIKYSYMLFISNEQRGEFNTQFKKLLECDQTPTSVFGISNFTINDHLNCTSYEKAAALCNIGHQFIIKQAIANSLPFCISFEDDAIFSNDCAINDFFTLLANIPDDADMVFFGYGKTLGNTVKYNEFFNKSTNSPSGTYAFLTANKFYTRYVKALEIKRTCDRVEFNNANIYLCNQKFFVPKRLYGKSIN